MNRARLNRASLPMRVMRKLNPFIALKVFACWLFVADYVSHATNNIDFSLAVVPFTYSLHSFARFIIDNTCAIECVSLTVAIRT